MHFPSAPISYSVEITYRCQNACPGCANVLRSHQHAVLHDWRTVFDRIAPPDNRRQYAELIRITGGEPSLHPEFQAIIAYADTLNIPHATFTNGRWDHPDTLIETFRQCRNCVGLLVSLHGSSAQAHAAFTGNHDSCFEQICANIRQAAAAGLAVFTNTVLTKDNCGAVDEIVALSQRLRAQCAVFNRYLGKPNPIEPSEKQLRQAIRRIETLQQQGVACRLGDCVPPCFEPNSSFGSSGGIEHCIIAPNGDVRPENLTSYTFGNLFEQSIEEIWQSERARWYREQIPAPCLECVELPRCRGGCRSVTVEYGLDGDRLMKTPLREPISDTLELDPAWIPQPYFTVRGEPFGYLLCRVNWSIPVTHAAGPLLDALDGAHTFADLHARFGDAGLALLGQLYRDGFLGVAP